MSELNKTFDNPKLPICKLTTLACICCIMIIPAIGCGILSDKFSESSTFMAITFALIASIIASPILAVIAKVRIALSDGKLGGNDRATLVIIATSILFIFAGGASMSIPKGMVERIVCGSNMKQIATAIAHYADENDDRLPLSVNWCDLLINEHNIKPKTFLCMETDASIGESSYALNRNALGVKFSELPSDMVLLFETNYGRADSQRDFSINKRQFVQELHDGDFGAQNKGMVFKNRWNQIGGLEMLSVNHRFKRSKSMNVALVSGDVEIVKLKTLDDITKLEALRWDTENTKATVSDSVSIDKSIFTKPVPPYAIIVAIGIITIGLTIATIIKYPIGHCLLLTIGLVLPSILFGGIFGSWGEGLYRPAFFQGLGGYGGAFLGMLTAICYVPMFLSTQKRLGNEESVLALAISMGIAAGMLCSSVLHLTLIVIHKDNYYAILAGLPFGAVGGAILGAITGKITIHYYRTTEGAEFINQQANFITNEELE